MVLPNTLTEYIGLIIFVKQMNGCVYDRLCTDLFFDVVDRR